MSEDDARDDTISLSSYTATTQSYDTLDDLMSRFTLEFKPEYTLKLRNRLGPIVVGIDGTHTPDLGENSGALVVKPSTRSAWWRRLRVDTTGEVTLRSRKLCWWVFTLDLEGHVHPAKRTSHASFRVATKWDIERGSFRNKKRVTLGDATEGRVHWSVNYNLPEVAGSFGTAARRVSRDVRADVGYAHAEVPKVELVVWPWRNSAKHLAAAAAANASVDAAAGEAGPSFVEVDDAEEPADAAAAVAAAVVANGGANPYLPDYLTSAGAPLPAAGSGRRQVRRANPVQEQLYSLARHLKQLSGTWQAPAPSSQRPE